MADLEVRPPEVVKVCKILHDSQIFICACAADGPNGDTAHDSFVYAFLVRDNNE